jgi:hypothetical protein
MYDHRVALERSPMLIPRALPSLFAASFALTAIGAAQDDPAPPPVPVEVRAFASQIDREGAFHLQLSFYPREDLEQHYRLRIALDCWDEFPTILDQELKPPTEKWRAGQEVTCEFDLRIPDDCTLEFGEEMAILLGFVGGSPEVVHAPLTGRPDLDDLVEIAALQMPGFLGEEGAAQLEAIFAEADRLKADRQAHQAWTILEDGLRRAGDDLTKERFRDHLLKIGRYPPAPMSPLEEQIVAGRILGEKVRYWRLVAGRMYDRRELHGALRLLEKAGGSLAENTDEAVIGATGDAQRVTQSIEKIRERLVRGPTREEEAEIRRRIGERGLTAELLAEAEELIEMGNYPIALGLLRRLRSSDDDEVEAIAWERLSEVEDEYLALTPPAQLAKVNAAIDHPVWGRTSFVASHRFIFIGPKELVEGLPEDSKLNFDLAYVFQTDLFGRVPNPEGDRLTVYFKELWDFGGGVGGGKIINIGKAEEEPKRPVRVDTGLLYHELTHCIDDTRPIFAGFREGLANLGAAYTFEALDRDGDALHSFDSNLEQFRRYFLDRDLEYWRIQNYGPSAGFFLHFVDEYAKLGKARHDWAPLRKFFREYREAPVRDGREPFIVRALGHYLTRAFGPSVFDDLVHFGFPLQESDRRALSLELEAFDTEYLDLFDGAFDEFPTSPLPRDLDGKYLARSADWEDEATADLREGHGILFQWKTVGPFFTRRADPAGCPFEPERHIDFDEPVPALRSTKDDNTRLVWRDPKGIWERDAERSPVTIDSAGWMTFDYEPYGQRNAAIYAATSVSIAEATDTLIHLRADDDFILFVDGERIGSYRGRGRNSSSLNGGWRGPYKMLPDAHRFPVHLDAGRHLLLVKIKNHAGKAGLVVALSKLDGSKLSFRQDTDPVAERSPARKTSWKRVVRLDRRSYRGKTRTEVGGFRSAGKSFYGTSTDGGVAWRRFTVRPGFPKDSPSNLLWLRPKLTKELSNISIEVELESDRGAPKLLITFQGEGGGDGLSGWSLILVPHGQESISARLERYDRLVYHSEPMEMAEVEGSRRLVLTSLDDEVTVSLDDVILFDRVPIYPIAGAHAVGLATWGPEPRIHTFQLSRSK